LKSDGTIYCWGYYGYTAESAGRWQCYGWNAAGQLGVGNTFAYAGFVDLCP